MSFLLIIPLLLAVRPWWHQRNACRRFSKITGQLAEIKRLLRTGGGEPFSDRFDQALCDLIRECRDQGYCIAVALSQSIILLRTECVQGLKANRLRLLWCWRMAAVAGLAIFARLFLYGEAGAALFGDGVSDRLLLLTGALVLSAGSLVFYGLIPVLQVSSDGGVTGLAEWLRHRIQADNGRMGATLPELQSIEDAEMCSGVSLHTEKIDALDTMWRARITGADARSETATELMAVFEFVSFGIFLVAALVVPLTSSYF